MRYAAFLTQSGGCLRHARLIGRKDFIGIHSRVIHDIDPGMLFPMGLLAVILQQHEHAAVVHPVAVDNGIKITEAAVLALQENRAHRAGGLFSGVVQIISVVASLHQRIGAPGVRCQNPAQYIAVDLLQRRKVYVPQGVRMGAT